jgi:hypothetical protein
MISVVCVHWGNKFSLDYVYNLKSAIEKNTTVPHEFVCFSDKEIPNVKTKILDRGLDGWWNKLQLFNTKFGLMQDVVYFDLDTLITGNIDWLMKHQTMFMGIEDLGSVNKHQPHLIGRFQSGVMKWKYSLGDSIWNTFLSNRHVIGMIRGDGEFLHEFIPKERKELIQRIFPGKLKSYKYQVYKEGLKDTSIVCFHGRPSIVQAISETVVTPSGKFEKQEWIKEYWR